MNVYLLNYNNYYNRTIKGYDTLSQYPSSSRLTSSTNVNLSYRNSLYNSLVFNDYDRRLADGRRPNYCIVCDDNDVIVSRWFVMSVEHKGSTSDFDQYYVSLKRDVVFDFRQDVLESTVFCRYGYKDLSSPLGLNQDNDRYGFNKIKYKESMIKETEYPWLYLYRTKTKNELNMTGYFDYGNMLQYGWQTIGTKLAEAVGTSVSQIVWNTASGLTITRTSDSNTLNITSESDCLLVLQSLSKIDETITSNIHDKKMSRSGNVGNVAINSYGSPLIATIDDTTDRSSYPIYIYNFLLGTTATVTNDGSNIVVSDIVKGQETTLSSSGLIENHTIGQFDIYAIPYKDELQISKEGVLEILGDIASDGATYDLQILPYGPYTLNSLRKVMVYMSGELQNFNMYVVKNPTRHITINTPNDYSYLRSNLLEDYQYGEVDYTRNKRGMNCYEIRLVSPDSQAIEIINPFFNYSDSTMLIDSFDIYMKLQPYSPYIQIKPVYKGYNGSNFDDYRGLICGSGFSVAIANDQWAQYQLNNKNYQQQFDREVQTANLNTVINTVGSVSKVATSAVSGFAMGGVAGAVSGGVAGGIDAAVGVVSDIYNISSMKKEFKWNIDNIQARSRTLKQVDAQNPNFKYFPYLEVFKCTNEEMLRFDTFLRKRGSKVMAEGKFKSFTNSDYTYVECVLDEFASDNLSSDMVNEIAKELEQGIYYEVVE